jgi:hypothetical protein
MNLNLQTIGYFKNLYTTLAIEQIWRNTQATSIELYSKP